MLRESDRNKERAGWGGGGGGGAGGHHASVQKRRFNVHYNNLHSDQVLLLLFVYIGSAHHATLKQTIFFPHDVVLVLLRLRAERQRPHPQHEACIMCKYTCSLRDIRGWYALDEHSIA